MTTRPAVVRAPGRAERTTVEMVQGDYARVFGLTPEAGRMIEASDDGPAARVCVISDQLWRQWFDRDRAVLGQTAVTVNDSRSRWWAWRREDSAGSVRLRRQRRWVPSAAASADGSDARIPS